MEKLICALAAALSLALFSVPMSGQSLLKADSLSIFPVIGKAAQAGDRRLAPFIPEGYTILSATAGNLNLDKYEDMVLIIERAAAPEIIHKDYKYEKSKWKFDFHLENIGNSDKISNLVNKLIYDNRNFDEYMLNKEKSVLINMDGDEPDPRGSYLSENYTINYADEKYIVISYHYEEYYGSAPHPNHGQNCFFIDISEKRLLLIDDLIKPLPENLLLALIKKRYEEDADIGIDDFLRNTIWPPDLITISGGNTALIWNTYTLFPHAYGPVEVTNYDISQHLTDKGKEIMKRLAAAAPHAEKPAADGDGGKTWAAGKNITGKFIPKGYRLFEELHGDLNGDGKDDYVAIIKGTDKEQVVKSENSDNGELIDRNRRGILIFFNNGNDYQLALDSRSCFASENEEGGTYFPPELSVSTGRGNLYIAYDWGKYGTWKYTLRYRNGEFVLIGYDAYSREMSVSGEEEREIEVVETNSSYNLLTKKVFVKTVTSYTDGGSKTDEKWDAFVVNRLVKLIDIQDFSEFDKGFNYK